MASRVGAGHPDMTDIRIVSNSFLFLVVRPGAPSSDALVPSSLLFCFEFLFLIANIAPSSKARSS